MRNVNEKQVQVIFEQKDLILLNQEYKELAPIERIRKLYQDFDPEDVMVTSSFATTSALLLKLISEVNPQQKIHFIETGYHFKETLDYKSKLTDLLDLNVVNTRAEKWKHEFTKDDKTWLKDPDLCCSINKVEPLERVKLKHRVWISGLMKWQSDHRSTLDIFEQRGEIVKFYPLLDITKEERREFIEEHQLPFHPLIACGYQSVGCVHCTVPGKGREGRWNNNPKTECGLHL